MGRGYLQLICGWAVDRVLFYVGKSYFILDRVNTKIILLPYFFFNLPSDTNKHSFLMFNVWRAIWFLRRSLVPRETQVWTAIYVTNVLINCMTQLIFSIQLMKFQIKMTCES